MGALHGSSCGRIVVRVVAAAIAALAISCLMVGLLPAQRASALDTPATCGQLAVKDGKLVSTKTGKAVVLRGVSLHGLAWFPQFVNNAAFKSLRNDWQANIVRLPLYTAEYGGYCKGGNKKQLMKLIDDGVRFATENDLYVIIDWHTLSDKNPNTHVKAAKKFFVTMAKRYRAHNNVIFEICNEPNGKTSWNSVKKYARKIIPAIRKKNKKAVVLVGTPEWCQRIDRVAASPLPKKYARNVMYTFHFYAGTHKGDMRDRLETALQKGIPVFVSEYGISDASGNGGLDKGQAQEWMNLLDKYGISRCAWNLSNKNESSAMVKPSNNDAGNLSFGKLSASGKWVYTAIRSAA